MSIDFGYFLVIVCLSFVAVFLAYFIVFHFHLILVLFIPNQKCCDDHLPACRRLLEIWLRSSLLQLHRPHPSLSQMHYNVPIIEFVVDLGYILVKNRLIQKFLSNPNHWDHGYNFIPIVFNNRLPLLVLSPIVLFIFLLAFAFSLLLKPFKLA